MITLYTGTPGSGKSMHATEKIIDALLSGKVVIANYSLDLTAFKKVRPSRFIYMDNSEMTPEYFTEFSQTAFKRGKEGQGLIVVDEAAILFNCRDFGRRDRDRWIKFFAMHRHYGWDVLLITQFDRMLDRQIRSLVEYEVIHRRVDNAGKYGKLFRFLKVPVFIAVSFWYGVRMRSDVNFFFVKPKIARAYNSYQVIS